MARAIAFDKNEVLEKITEVFISKGFQATSLDSVAALTGLKKTSLYNTFGNKEAIFKHCVDHYLGSILADSACLFHRDKSLGNNIRPLMYAAFFTKNSDQLRSGCLLVNSVLELSTVNESLYGYVCAKKEMMEKSLLLLLQSSKELDLEGRGVAADFLVDYLTILVQGLRIQVRAGISANSVCRSIDNAMQMLDLLEVKDDNAQNLSAG